MRINVGCGTAPTEGWRNYDGSLSVRIARRPALRWALRRMGFVDEGSARLMEVAARTGIRWADVARRIPERDSSIEVVYASHMLEHMAPDDVDGFLREAARVLRPGGILRLAVPDVRFHVDRYVRDGDADAFMTALHVSRPPPRGVRQTLRYLATGDRHHQWMYDGPSLCRRVERSGFVDARTLAPGETTIPDPQPLNLREREPESVYVEARRGGRPDADASPGADMRRATGSPGPPRAGASAPKPLYGTQR